MDRITEFVDAAMALYRARRRRGWPLIATAFGQDAAEFGSARGAVERRLMQFSDYIPDRADLEKRARDRYAPGGILEDWVGVEDVAALIPEMATDELAESLKQDGLAPDLAEKAKSVFMLAMPPLSAE